MKVLVAGGAGYIGSHALVELISSGYEPIVVDNLSNSKEEAIHRVEKITGKKIEFYKLDLLDKNALQEVFKKHIFGAVINFAGLKAVGESVAKPILYYHNNITSMLILLEVMKEFGVKNLVFPSSATVYGVPKEVQIKEEFPLPIRASSPYGTTKLFIEQILRDLYSSDNTFNIAILRYFNPIGAHESGLIGENPKGTPNNLAPYITKVAIGEKDKLSIMGGDYKTHDGTGVRDYIHVVDLAKSNVLALKKLEQNCGLFAVNIGSGKGSSVLDLIKSFSKAVGREIPYEILARRPGDIDAFYADSTLAEKFLGFKAEKNLDDMCRDAWNWQKNNPNGY